MNISIDISQTILETERLTIRPWRPEDLSDFFEYASVDGVGQMAGWPPHKSMAESQEILQSFIEGKHTFALELKRNHKVIGSLGLDEMYFDLGEPYSTLQGREIGYVLSKDYWGKGLMPEAVRRVIEYCFHDLDCEYLQCSHALVNQRSQRVIEKSGFQYIRDCVRTAINGESRPSKVYVLMKETLDA